MPGSRAMTRRPLAVFGSLTTTSRLMGIRARRTERRPSSRSTSLQRRPMASPRRMPVMAIVCQRGRGARRLTALEERLELLLGPGLHLLRAVALLARRVGGVERVPRDVPPPDRVLAGLVQAGVDVVDGHGGEARLAILAPGLGELRVEGVDLGAAELLQLHRADVRHDVALDVLHVGVVGRGPDRRLDRRQPLLGQVLLHRGLGRRRVVVLLDGDQQLVHRRLALLLRGEAALGLAAAFLGLLQGAAALRAALLGPALDPEALVAGRAPLRRRQADVDDVLPAAGLAALSHVTSHVLPQTRVYCATAASLWGRRHSNERWRTVSTECLPTTNLFGARPTSRPPICRGRSPPGTARRGRILVTAANGRTGSSVVRAPARGGQRVGAFDFTGRRDLWQISASRLTPLAWTDHRVQEEIDG